MHVETADKLIVMGGVRKCVVCELGFPKVGSLEPEVRLEEHEKITLMNYSTPIGSLSN